MRKSVEAEIEEQEARKARWGHLFEGKIDASDRSERKDVRIITEILLENTQAFLDNPAALSEDVVTTGQVGPFTTFAFPLVRRVWPRLLANDLVSVQPMTQPTGKIFFIDRFYTGTANRVDLPANFDRNKATTAENTSVQEINLNITSQTVTAERKALKAKWTIESAQDLMAYHGLNAEGELMAMVADELVREIDRLILNDIISNVPSQNKFTFDTAVPTSGPYSLIDPKVFARTLWSKILDANNAIFTQRYVNATWLVCSSKASVYLEKLDEFTANPNGDPTQWQSIQGSHFLGTLGNRWLVYKDPWLDTLNEQNNSGTILIGYKGNNFMHAGYVYAPYIPVFTTPLLVDPNDFTSRRGMMSRYGKAMVIPEMYATIILS